MRVRNEVDTVIRRKKHCRDQLDKCQWQIMTFCNSIMLDSTKLTSAHGSRPDHSLILAAVAHARRGRDWTKKGDVVALLPACFTINKVVPTLANDEFLVRIAFV